VAFRRIDYLEWARTQMGKVRYDLARSNIKGLTREELGLTLDHVALSAPDEGHPGLRELLAKRYATSPSNLLVTSGATQAIYLAFAALLEPGDRVLLETPHYEPLARAAEERGAELRPLERRFERGFQVELEEMERAVGRSTRAIVLTNLHNPSGAATSAEKLQQIGQLARENGATVVASEVYLGGAFAPGLQPAATLGPNLVSIGSLSKVYGLGGLRIGWMVADEALIRKARAALDYLVCDLPAPSESIALAALKRADEWAERCRGIARRNVAAIREWVEKREDVEWCEPAGGTVCLLKLPPGLDAPSFSAQLREKQSTLVVPGDFFGLPGFIRISAGMDEELLRQGLKNVGKGIDQWKAQRG
jgi:aspartate/methionine/tyrosine aminotransferase